MRYQNQIAYGYENTKLVRYDEIGENFFNTHAYDKLGEKNIVGVLKANQYVDGHLLQTYSKNENHVGVIAATRLGKTSQYVIPTILSFAKQKVKKRMIIADPKGELYKITSETLRREGYIVKLIDLRRPLKSENWNPLTPIFREYQKAYYLENEVALVETPDGYRNEFLGTVFNDQKKLDETIAGLKRIKMEDVISKIDSLVTLTISIGTPNDPFWEETARILLKALIMACLEDSVPEVAGKRMAVTEDNFSFSTILKIMENMHDNDSGFNDGGFFTSRPETSFARIWADDALDTAPNTRRCILNVFNSKMSVYKASTMRLITCCNSFEMDELIGDKPIALFISFRDELKEHYQVLSTFVQSAYAFLIDHATKKQDGKLDVPFYFLLDEFGQFPGIANFQTVISACAGRNIWFILVVQSLNQLNDTYGENVARIIWDNLNLHVFLGSNNLKTLKDFSSECGEYTRIAPSSALNGDKDEIDHFTVETIPLVPKSTLASLEEGTCIITEANCGYVMFSRLERYYNCREFKALPIADPDDYQSTGDPLANTHDYYFVKKKKI